MYLAESSSIRRKFHDVMQFNDHMTRNFPDRRLIRLAQLDFTVGRLKLISEGHSFHYAGAPYKHLYGGVPYKSPKIAENRRKSEPQADLRRLLILPLAVKSSCAGHLAPRRSHLLTSNTPHAAQCCKYYARTQMRW